MRRGRSRPNDMDSPNSEEKKNGAINIKPNEPGEGIPCLTLSDNSKATS